MNNSKQYHLDLLNIHDAWKHGANGTGVVVGIIDDGIDITHPDLKQNYIADLSWDYNLGIPGGDIQNKWDGHGTRCAGEIAAASNATCGAGIAPFARLASIRILGKGDDIDADHEARAVLHKNQNIDVYSCSWGPSDNGSTLDRPSAVVQDALRKGVEQGRNQKGNVFVLASGNGGESDGCHYDGYAGNIHTFTISAVDRYGVAPSYAEGCPAVLAAAIASENNDIYTTLPRFEGLGLCGDSHGGTSAAAPQAAGVYALVLSVRPELSWRDLQYMTVYTSRTEGLSEVLTNGWSLNGGLGRPYSDRFGYGVLDAGRMVRVALDWTLMSKGAYDRTVVFGFSDSVFLLDGVERMLWTERIEDVLLTSLEHVVVTLSVRHGCRGDVRVELVSPMGVRSELSPGRSRDDFSGYGYVDWEFMTVKHWGEPVTGSWGVMVSDRVLNGLEGELLNMSITFRGVPLSLVQSNLRLCSISEQRFSFDFTWLVLPMVVLVLILIYHFQFISRQISSLISRFRKRPIDHHSYEMI